MIECDELQHEGYEEPCEISRTNNLAWLCGEKPLILIRFNPDGYSSQDGILVPSCFRPIPSGYDIDEPQWKRRVHYLQQEIYLALDYIPDIPLTEIKLFFDEQ